MFGDNWSLAFFGAATPVAALFALRGKIMKKRKFTYVLTLVFLCVTAFCLFGITSSAETTVVDSGICGEGVTWKIESGRLIISGSGEITVPFEFEDGRLNGYEVHDLVVEDGITSICDDAFYGNSFYGIYLSSKGSLKYIGGGAFSDDGYGNSLEALIIPEGVTYFGGQAISFVNQIRLPSTIDNCYLNILNLGSLDIGRFTGDLFLTRGDARVTNISVGASNSRYHVENNCLIESETGRLVVCGGTRVAYSSPYYDANIPLDGSVTTIGAHAFLNFDDYYITIPKSVTKIESSAFGNYSLHNTTIHYEGTAEDWAKVDIGDYNEVLQSDIFSCHVHEFGEWSIVYEETCTSDGLKESECTTCGETVSETIPAAHELIRKYGKEATCTEGGYNDYYVCSGCDYSTYEYISPVGHLFVTYISNKDATCTQDGTKTATCKRCDEQDTVTDRETELGHKMGRATCTEAASCQREGCEHTEGEPLGHLEISHDAKAPTCTESGWNEYQTCQRCNYSSKKTISKLGHSFINYKSNGNAACTSDGTKTSKCERCAETDTVTDTGSALGHDMSEATCTETPKCAREGCEYTEGYMLGHDFSLYIANDDATCTEDGTKTATCGRCGKTNTIINEESALGHSIVQANCTLPERCVKEGCSYIVGSALGHSIKYHSAKAPTCTEIGWNEYESCLRCSYLTYLELSELGHSFLNYHSDNNATCTQDGTKTSKCERCAETDTVTDTGSALGHDMSAATCTEASICQREGCNHTEGTVTEHTYLNENDSDCNICGSVRDVVHDDGLSTGGIVAIFAGSTVVVGTGGFSLFWFVIKKKKFADLIAIFKK